MTVDARVLKVDSGCSVSSDDNLELFDRRQLSVISPRSSARVTKKGKEKKQGRDGTNLVIPPIRTRPHLHPLLKLISPTQHITTHLTRVLRTRIVQRNHKQRFINHFKTHLVPLVRFEGCTVARPDGSGFGG
jgi:hypothetical protein